MIYQKVLFSKDECNRILNEHNTFVKSKIVHNSSLYKEDNLIRTSNESTIPLSFELKTLLLNKLKELYKDLKWDFPPLNSNVTKFFAF